MSPADLAAGACAYVRGDDMPSFPGKAWVEARMPVYLLPRTDAVSSTFIKRLYGGGGGGGAEGAGADAAAEAPGGQRQLVTAFARLDYTGKPLE